LTASVIAGHHRAGPDARFELERLAAFVGLLREAGLPVPADALGSFAPAVALVGHERDGLYWAGRATLVARREHIDVYDLAFATFWRHTLEPIAPDVAPAEPIPDRDARDAADAADPSDADEAPPLEPTPWLRASRREVLRTREFAAYEPHELIEARALMAELRLTADRRLSRRTRGARRARGHLDLRATVAAAHRTGGEIVRLHRTTRISAPRRVVFLLDVSGSMAAYSRALLQFSQVAATARSDVEIFTIGTRLTRLTRQLRCHDPDDALARAAAAVPDWAGGTRLGQSLKSFNDEWGIRGTARGAVVVLLSDGWERDEPHLLVGELQRLRRVAHRIVWVNPLKASEGYAPVARGMAAALPHVDAFVSGHNLESLGEVALAVGWAQDHGSLR
jgi:uncharacterized protein with von Willebrand factor type A (vWA) domain